MLGANELPLRQGFHLRRKRAAGQMAGRCVGWKSCELENIGFNRPFHVGAGFASLAPTYFISQSALTPLLRFSTCDPLRWARSWRAALRAAIFRF